MSRKDVSDKLVCLAYAEYNDAMRRRSKNLRWPYEILSEWTGQPEKVCYSAMERSYNKGYIEFGVSMRSGWLTEAGKELIRGESAPNNRVEADEANAQGSDKS